MGPVALLREYERGVVYTLGRFDGVKGPGMVLVIPVIQQMVRVDLRPRKVTVTEEVTSNDNAALSLDADVSFKVVAPEKAVNNVTDYAAETVKAAREALRRASGSRTQRDIQSNLAAFTPEVCKELDAAAAAWGVNVSEVVLRQTAAVPVN